MLFLNNVFSGILDLFRNLGNFFVEKVGATYQPSALLFYIALGAFLIYVIVTIVRTSFSYEMKLIKSIDHLNMYFYKNPQITEENLIEFNNKMKQVPKAVRVQWQLFMLNRDKPASEYLNLENCVERPMKTTTYKHSVKTINIIFNIFIVLLGIISFAGLVSLTGDNQLGTVLYYAFVMPFLIYVLKSVFMIFLNIRLNATISDLYNNFNVFQRGLDKAVTTLPAYIDYEVLFTKKEIKSSIPILQDYIEKRERMEKEELERARQAQVEHERYDFSSVGFDASLLLDRMTKECEIYINNKKRLSFEVGQVEEEIRILTINFEEKLKDNLKQQQLCRENLERLRMSAENSTSRVTANTIKKQQETELKRQEDLEIENRRMQEEYDKHLVELKARIESLQDDQVNKKKNIEFAVISEFRTYADKVYTKLDDEAKKHQQSEYDKVVDEKNAISEELKNTYVLIEEKDKKIASLEAELASKKAQIEKASNELVDVAAMPKAEPKEPEYDENGGYYDSEGYYRFKDGGYYTPDGKYYDADGTYIPSDEETIEEVFEPVYDENGGYFDSEGFYRYKDGSFYDPEGNFYDANGVKQEKTEAEKANKAETKRVEDAKKKAEPKKKSTKTTKSTAKTTKSTAKTASKSTSTKSKTGAKKTTKKNDELDKINDELEKANKELLENHEDFKSSVDSTNDI